MRRLLPVVIGTLLAGTVYAVVLIKKPAGGGGGVAIDASSIDDDTDGSTNEATFSWSHNPVAAPRGVGVFVHTLANADYIVSVTYDGEALTQISEALDTSGEPARTTLFYLGTGVNTTDPATIIVTRAFNSACVGSADPVPCCTGSGTGTCVDATPMTATAFTVTAAGDTEAYAAGIVLVQGTSLHAEQNVTDGSTGVDSLRFAGIYTGQEEGLTASGTASTLIYQRGLDSAAVDFINVALAMESTAGQGSRPVGLINVGGSTDDSASIYVAIRDIP